MAQTHQFKVEMTCLGCSSAVEKVLRKLAGDGKMHKLDIDLANRMVYVTGDLEAEEVLETIKKTGKETKYIATL